MWLLPRRTRTWGRGRVLKTRRLGANSCYGWNSLAQRPCWSLTELTWKVLMLVPSFVFSIAFLSALHCRAALRQPERSSASGKSILLLSWPPAADAVPAHHPCSCGRCGACALHCPFNNIALQSAAVFHLPQLPAFVSSSSMLGTAAPPLVWRPGLRKLQFIPPL